MIIYDSWKINITCNYSRMISSCLFRQGQNWWLWTRRGREYDEHLTTYTHHPGRFSLRKQIFIDRLFSREKWERMCGLNWKHQKTLTCLPCPLHVSEPVMSTRRSLTVTEQDRERTMGAQRERTVWKEVLEQLKYHNFKDDKLEEFLKM